MKRNFLYPPPEQQARAAALRAAPSLVLQSVAVVFLCEVFAHLLRRWFELQLGWMAALLDATLLAVLAVPVLYLLMVRRLVKVLAQESAAAAERRFHAISAEISDGVLIIDDHANILMANPAAERIYRLPPGSLAGKNVASLVPDDRLDGFRRDFAQFRASGEGVVIGRGVKELEGLRANGERFPVEVSVSVFQQDGQNRMATIVRDTTERKRVEREMARLASFPEASPNPVLECDSEGEVVYANPSARQVLDLAGRTPAGIRLLIPELAKALRDCMARQQLRFGLETEVHGHTLLWTLQPFPERGHIHAYATDITDRKAAEEALLQSEQQLRDLLDTLPVAIRVVREEKTVFANAAAARLFGLASPRQLIGTDPRDLVSPRDRQRLAAYHRQRVLGGESPARYEATYLRSDGSEFPVEVSATPFLYEGAPGSLAVIRDLTEEKRLHLYEQILPVCCVCGKIRDDSGKARGAGKWGRLDHYVMRHSNTQLSHTFCPDCLEEYKHQQGIR